MNVLSIGGSDPSSGAGIQSDIKTFSILGAYGFSVITAITSQNTKKFSKVEPISQKMIKSQLDSIFSDFTIDAIKIGMVFSNSIIKTIYAKLCKTKIPIVLDPIIESTTGGILLEKNALINYKKFLIPLAHVITPNVSEAEKISGVTISNKNDLLKCASLIKKMGAKNVVITGLQFEKGKIFDYVLDDTKHYVNIGTKLPNENHGSGCNYSSSLTVAIGMGKPLSDSTKFAKTFTYNSIKKSKLIGKGISLTNPIHKTDKTKEILREAIFDLKNVKKFYSVIPECQTNFVYSELYPKSVNNIVGVQGRIVKVGRGFIVAGDLEYGGSIHVASAILEMTKKFPQTKSALNIKYDPKLIKKSKKNNFLVLNYDRAVEPKNIKKKENASISWGIKIAIKNCNLPPDIVFHKGDFGKEPMILVFGNDPQDVVRKISSVL